MASNYCAKLNRIGVSPAANHTSTRESQAREEVVHGYILQYSRSRLDC